MASCSSGPGSSGAIDAGSMMTPVRGAGTRTGAGAGAAWRSGSIACGAARRAAAPERRSPRRAARRRRALHGGGDALVRRPPDECVERAQGRDGRPTVADDPVRHPGFVVRARAPRGRATRAPRHDCPSASSMSAISRQTRRVGRPLRRIRADERGDRRARGGEIMRLQRRASHGQKRFGIAGRGPGERAGAGQPVLGRIAVADPQIGGGEVRVGRLRVSGLEDPAGAAIVARLRGQPAADRGGGHERWGKAAGLLRENERCLRDPAPSPLPPSPS